MLIKINNCPNEEHNDKQINDIINRIETINNIEFNDNKPYTYNYDLPMISYYMYKVCYH
jgi:Asp-tRNA(Asn)/Glu-tRNA(Gln) amidotransferase C subunit